MKTTLSKLGRKKKGIIKYLEGGRGFQTKIIALGIRVGKQIKVISSHPFGGPIVVEIDNMRIAIGRGMADRIIVEVI